MTAGIKANLDGSAAIQVGGTDVIGLGTAGQIGIGGANYGTSGQVFTSGGSSAAPTWSQVNLTSGVTGTLPVANGGTGQSSLTANNVILGNGTSAAQFVAPGTNGNVLTSNGTTWTSAAAAGGFPAGTAMLFVQTAAPTGWTKSTTHNDKALRVVSGTASSGGSVAFTTAFASQSVSGTVGSTTLSTAEMPSHTHASGYGSSSPLPRFGSVSGLASARIDFSTASSSATTTGAITTSTGGGGSHNHTFTGTAINLAVQYVDVIIATKD